MVRRASLHRSQSFIHLEDSRLEVHDAPESLRVPVIDRVTRWLRYFPMLLLVVVLVCAGCAVREFLAERAHQAIELGQLSPRGAQAHVRR